MTTAVREHQRMNSAQKLQRLGELALEARQNVFERIRLTTEILDDRLFVRCNKEWAERDKDGNPIPGAPGCEESAQDDLEEKYFPDLKGWLRLSTMRSIFNWCSDEDTWREVGFSMRAMHERWLAWNHGKRGEAGATPRKGPNQKRIEELEHSVSTHERRVGTLTEENVRLRQENDKLRSEVNGLRVQVQVLTARLEEREKLGRVS